MGALASAELHSLVCKAKSDQRARDKVVSLFRPLTFSLVRRLNVVMSDDIRQECVVGLLHAIDRWKPGGLMFPNYATMWMRALIFEYLREQNIVQLGRSQKSSKILWRLRGPLSDDELSLRSGMKLDDVKRMRAAASLPTSDGQENEMSYSVDPREDLYEQITAREVMIAIGTLKPRLRGVLLSRMHGDTLQQLALVHGVSRERMRQLEIDAVRDLREYLDN